MALVLRECHRSVLRAVCRAAVTSQLMEVAVVASLFQWCSLPIPIVGYTTVVVVCLNEGCVGVWAALSAAKYLYFSRLCHLLLLQSAAEAAPMNAEVWSPGSGSAMTSQQ